MDSKLKDWILDDITWCWEKECPNTECFRHLSNRKQKTGLFAVSMLKDTELCPLKNNAAEEKE